MAARKKRGPRRSTKLTARQKAKARRIMARRIGEARLEAGLTQKAVAEAVRLSPSVVSKIERGERHLDPLELVRFAKLYGKTIGELVG